MQHFSDDKIIKRIACCFLFILLFYHSLNKTNNIITNSQPTDGFGSQFQHIIATAVYAELNGYTYLYTPFVSMEHNYDEDLKFLEKKEHFINFIGNFDLAENNPSYIQKNINYKGYFDSHTEACAKSTILKKIKKCFKENKQKKDYFDPNYYNIAVHVRRPNPQDNRVDGTDTPNSIYLKIIDHLRKLYADKNVLFHIFSQGAEDNFLSFKNKDTVIHLNDSIEYSFASLVFADVLVTSRSSFSYTAALLSDGIVYYLPFWHTPLPHWISGTTLTRKTPSLSFIFDKYLHCFALHNLQNVC